MINKPFIKLINVFNEKYMYDVNRNIIIKLTDELSNYLNGGIIESEMSSESKNKMLLLKANGLMSNNRLKEINHPMTDHISVLLDRNLSYFILQVTQECNLRCSYCPYTNPFNNRSRKHSEKTMDFSTAKKCIDFFAEKSVDSKVISLGFYGGEPLMNFSLIQECVAYAKQVFSGKKIIFNMTTNGTMLTPKIVSFLNDNEFSILVSIDGIKEIHDKNRKFKNGEGSYDIIIKNIERIRKECPKFLKRISYNSVIDLEDSFSCNSNLFAHNNVFHGSDARFSLVGEYHKENETHASMEFINNYKYERFKLFLFFLNELASNYISPLIYNSALKIIDGYKSIERTNLKLPEKSHPSGPCIPGVTRTFVNTGGVFYPCEKVNEEIEALKIGHIDSGYNLERVSEILNIGKLTEDSCKNCWGLSLCMVCVDKVQGDGVLSVSEKQKNCKKALLQAENKLKDYIILKKFGLDVERKYMELLTNQFLDDNDTIRV